jgi:3-hydroxyisobutyrate dehydrogenase-like beta-hydroxyacid dehydrogenase
MKSIGFVGLGNMGMGMARNLLRKGFTVRGYARRREVVDELEREGGVAVPSAADTARGSTVVILMVLDAAQVTEILDGGLLEALAPRTTLIITATIGQRAVQDVWRRLDGRDVRLVDAPVSGGKSGAEAGTLTFMAAAPKATLDDVEDVLRALGASVHHVGTDPGQGQVVKACLQALIGVSFQGLFEAMVLGAKAGVDSEVLSTVINDSFVASKLTSTTTAHIVARRFRNTGSHIGTMHKDFGISLDMARELGVPMPAASVAMQMFQAGKTAIPDGDNACIVEVLEKLAATTVRRTAAG